MSEEDDFPEWMHVRFFGEPWPSRELRAPICEDDRWEVPTPREWHWHLAVRC